MTEQAAAIMSVMVIALLAAVDFSLTGAAYVAMGLVVSAKGAVDTRSAVRDIRRHERRRHE